MANVAKRTVRFVLSLSEEEGQIIEKIKEGSPLAGLEVDRNLLMRYILRSYDKMLNVDVITKDDLAQTEARILAGLATRGNTATVTPITKRGKGAAATGMSKEEKEEAERENGLRICKLLEGRNEGDMCMWKKYEITAGGFTAEYEVSDHLLNLSEKLVEDQFDPSRDEYMKLKAEEAAKEAGKS